LDQLSSYSESHRRPGVASIAPITERDLTRSAWRSPSSRWTPIRSGWRAGCVLPVIVCRSACSGWCMPAGAGCAVLSCSGQHRPAWRQVVRRQMRRQAGRQRHRMFGAEEAGRCGCIRAWSQDAMRGAARPLCAARCRSGPPDLGVLDGDQFAAVGDEGRFSAGRRARRTPACPRWLRCGATAQST